MVDGTKQPFGTRFKGLLSRIGGGFKAQSMTLSRSQSETQFREEMPESWHDVGYWQTLTPRYSEAGGVGFVTPPYVAYWDRIWGVTQVEDLVKYKELYVRVPFIKSAIDITVALAVGRGFDLMGDDDVVDLLKSKMEALHIIDLIKIIATDMLVFGNAYFEIVRIWKCVECKFETSDKVQMWRHLEENEDHYVENIQGEFVNLKPHDPVWMKVRRDPYGMVYGYIQYLAFPLVTFMTDEIIHFKFSSKSWDFESAYGTSMLRALLRIEALIDETETNLGIIYYTYTKPMFVVKIGDAEHASTPEQYREVIDQFQNRRQASDVFVRGDIVSEVKEVGSLSKTIDVSYWLDYLERQREYALLPFSVITGRAGGNKANQEVARQLYTSQLRLLQEEIGMKMVDYLFRPLVERYFPEKKVPRIVWKPILDPEMTTLLAMSSRGFEDTLLTRNESRGLIGMPQLDEKKFPAMGEQLFEPTETGAKGANPTPSLPGSNEEKIPRPFLRRGKGLDEMREEFMKEVDDRISDLPENQYYRKFQRRER